MQMAKGCVAVGALAMVALGGMAYAQEAPTYASNASAWDVQLTPYVWGTGIGGTVQPYASGPTGHVSESLSDVLHDLDAAFFMNAIVRKDKFLLHLDMTRASLTKSAAVDVAPGVNLQGRAKIRQSSLGVQGGYRWEQSEKSVWDWMAGFRTWNVRTAVYAGVPGLGDYAALANKSFTYPVLAARWRYQFDERWSTLVYLDAGTQGRHGNYTWQGMVTLNYALQKQWYLSAGYRYLSLNYNKRGTQFDLAQQGPLLGVTYRF